MTSSAPVKPSDSFQSADSDRAERGALAVVVLVAVVEVLVPGVSGVRLVVLFQPMRNLGEFVAQVRHQKAPLAAIGQLATTAGGIR